MNFDVDDFEAILEAAIKIRENEIKYDTERISRVLNIQVEKFE